MVLLAAAAPGAVGMEDDARHRLEPLNHSAEWYLIARSISESTHTDIVEKESRQRRKDIRAISEREFRSRLPDALAQVPEELSRADWAVWQGGAAAICDSEQARCTGEGNHLGAIAMMETAILLLCDVEEVEDEVRTRLADLVAYYNRRAVKCIENGKTGYALAKKLLGRALALTARPMAAILSNQDVRLRLRATTLNNLGCLYRRKGKGHAALKFVEMALKLEAEISGPLEDPASTHLNLCAILSGLRQHKVAIKHARTAIDNILSQIGVDQDLLDMIPDGHVSQVRNLMIGYHNMACCYEAAMDEWAAAKALDSLDRAIIIGERFFARDPIVDSLLAHRKALGKQAAQAARAAAAPPPAKDDETRAAEPEKSVREPGSSTRSARPSARRSGRSHRPRGARSNNVKSIDGGSQHQDEIRSTTTLPSIARSHIGERPVEFVPVRPLRPQKPRQARPAYNFRDRRTGATYDARTGATTVPLGRRRKVSGPERRGYGHDVDAQRAWHQQLGDPSLPPPNQRLLTTMELHMVHDLRQGSVPVSTHMDSAVAVPDGPALNAAHEGEPGGSLNDAISSSGGINRLDSQHAANGKTENVQEARKVFDSFANGKQFLHRAALSEVLKNAYRSAHNSSSRQAQAATDQLLEQMKIDTTTLPPPPPPQDELELIAEDEASYEGNQDNAQETWLRHVYNPEHITFDEFVLAWDSWQKQ